jgi:hypothetical protein
MMHINEEALVDYLYEEGDAAERLKIAQHLQDCATCSVAVLELQAVRGILSDWTPPAAHLGFKIVQEPTKTSWWRPGMTAASLRSTGLQAAAAALIFAAGVAVSQLNVEYGDGAVTVRTRSAALPANAPVAAVPVATPARALSEAAPAPDFSANQTARPEPSSREISPAAIQELERRIEARIAQSEARQQRELALRLTQMGREVDTQRVADLMRVEQTFGQLENQTGAEIAQQRELMDYIVKTSGR